jgi:hypothetical protein
MPRPIKYLTEEDKKEAKKLARKKYAIKNKDKVYKQQKNWRDKNPDKSKLYVKNYAENNISKVKENRRKYYLINKEKEVKYYTEYRKKRKIDDNLFKLKGNIRCLISNSFKKYKFKKTSKTAKILGCTFEDFKNYLESKFEPWMNWNNHGYYNGSQNYGWDIDHIVPLSSAITEEDVIKLNHYSNLQPLCSYYNRDIKRNKK